MYGRWENIGDIDWWIEYLHQAMYRLHCCDIIMVDAPCHFSSGHYCIKMRYELGTRHLSIFNLAQLNIWTLASWNLSATLPGGMDIEWQVHCEEYLFPASKFKRWISIFCTDSVKWYDTDGYTTPYFITKYALILSEVFRKQFWNFSSYLSNDKILKYVFDTFKSIWKAILKLFKVSVKWWNIKIYIDTFKSIIKAIVELFKVSVKW